MVAVGGDGIGGSFHFLCGVAHSDPQTRSADHGEVVALIPHGDGLLHRNPQRFAHSFQGCSLIYAKGRDLLIVGDAAGPGHRQFFQFRSAAKPFCLTAAVEIDLMHLVAVDHSRLFDVIHPDGAGLIKGFKALTAKFLHATPAAFFYI